MVKYGNEINEIEEEYVDRTWYKPIAEFAVLLVILMVVLAGVTLRASTKSVIISETVRSKLSGSMFEEDIVTDWFVMKTVNTGNDGKIYVPLPMTARSENISVENYYQDSSLFIRVEGVHSVSFETAEITGDTEHLLTAAFREYGGEIRICLLMDGVWDYNISQDNTQLVITPYKAKEKYEKTVLLVADKPDSAKENSRIDSAEITSEVADLAAKMLLNELATAEKIPGVAIIAGVTDKSEKKDPARIYVAEYRSDEEVLDFIDKCEADMVVFLKTDVSLSPDTYGMKAAYNGEYFIPELDNAALAEIFLRNTAISASNKAIEITEAEEGSILYKVTIPAAELTIGYASNEKESSYLKKENYQRYIAEGIVNAVKEVTQE
jgi:hypothetical protein